MITSDGGLELIPSQFDVDCITVGPWIGEPTFRPFVDVCAKHGKGIFIVDKTSFKPASPLQEIETEFGRKAWMDLAETAARLGDVEGIRGESGYASVGVVIDATYPYEAHIMKQLIPPHDFEGYPLRVHKLYPLNERIF